MEHGSSRHLAEAPGERPGFSIRLVPTWEQIEPLRVYLGAWLRSRAPADAIDRAGLVIQELLENAVKYGDPAIDIELSVQVSRGGNFIDVRVTNHAHPSRIAILERELKRARENDPQEAFTRAIERLQKLPKGTSMLGLSRVALESTLEYEVGRGSVTVIARIAHNRNLAKVGSAKVPIQEKLQASSSGAHHLATSVTPPSHTRSRLGDPDTVDGVEPRIPIFRK
jgi:anti-sigma regulatory factor (Ser/Thr protein kinase)